MDRETNWETSSSWYDKIVGAKGHYYHDQVILPEVMKLLKTGSQKDPYLLDLACGQGVLSRHLPKGMKYLGIDGSKSLIAMAKKYGPHEFLVHDLSKPLDLPNKEFSHATAILAIQNFEDPTPVFQTAFSHLRKGGLFIIVINHPTFRIPRQSSWGIDEAKKLQYRRIDRYFSSLKIPIQTHPGKEGASEQTWSFHNPLSYFTKQLTKVGFAITGLDEWCSNRTSIGRNATMENRSRQEFPLFMTLVCKKL
jgi:SAM-dependent methyltransferase